MRYLGAAASEGRHSCRSIITPEERSEELYEIASGAALLQKERVLGVVKRAA
jgi:hypothetical protein